MFLFGMQWFVKKQKQKLKSELLSIRKKISFESRKLYDDSKYSMWCFWKGDSSDSGVHKNPVAGVC